MARILIGNIKGPQGAQGIQGPQGPVGATGPQGPMPDLINNALATQAGVAALDAAMGKVLQDQITQLNSDLIGEKIVFTPYKGSSYDGYDNCFYKRSKNMVIVHIGMCGLDENKATHIFTMPSELKPIGLARSYGNNGKSDLGLSMAQIDGDGNVIVTSSGTYASCDVVYMI